MNPWRPYPLIRLALAFMAGIIAAIYGPGRNLPLCIVILTAMAAVLLAAFPGWLAGYRLRGLRGVIIFAALFAAGYQYTLVKRQDYFRVPGRPGRACILMARITEQPVARAKSLRLPADLWIHDSVSGVFRSFSKGWLYMEKSIRAECLTTGDIVVIYGKPELLPLPDRPGGFNMREWSARKGLFHRLYVPTHKWKFLCGRQGFSLKALAEGIRDRLLDILRRNNLKGEEFAVAAALMLGYVSEIDQELLSDYSSTGAMHILSVSGMHVGVIYLFLEFLAGLLERRRRNNSLAAWLKSGFMIFFIWVYAILTGLSPPVQRAAIMLSMIIAGKNLKRQPGILNILAASLFLVLLSDPLLVLDVGCQFSYLAVAGIVLLYQPVYDLYVTSKWLPDKLWSLAAVSIAAQLVTFPLGLFVFHQFPNYFLLTNILAVPLSSLIIYAGIFLLLTGHVPWLGPLSGQMLSWLVGLLNRIIRMIDALPGSSLKGVMVTFPQMILLYAIIIFLFLFLVKRRNVWLFLALSACLLIPGHGVLKQFHERSVRAVIIYGGKETCMEFVAGSHRFAVSGKPDSLPPFLAAEGRFYLFGKSKIAILDTVVPAGLRHPIKVDLLVISSGPRMKLREILRAFHARMVVADGSNPPWRVSEWKREAALMGVRLRDTGEEGSVWVTMNNE